MLNRYVDFIEVLFHKGAFFYIWFRNPVLKQNISFSRVVLHDTAKAINILRFGDEVATILHRTYAGHHNFNCIHDLWEAICDWESAPVTKVNKPFNARETWRLFYNFLPCKELLDLANL